MIKRNFSIALLIFLIFIAAIEASPTYTIKQVASGTVPGLTVSTKGNIHSNLGLTLRFISSAPISCTIEIPAGTVFSGSSLAKTSSGARNSGGSQSMLSPFGQYASLPGGSLPKKSGSTATNYYYDCQIIALCMNVDLPPPDSSIVIPAVITSISAGSHLNSFIDSITAFQSSIETISRKIDQGVELTDNEFERAKFLEWVDTSSTGYWRALAKQIIPTSQLSKRQAIMSSTRVLEIIRTTLQNALWAMIPGPDMFSGKAIRDQIIQALHIETSGKMDSLAKTANDFLCLMGQSRRLYCADSLSKECVNEVYTPDAYSRSWGGAGGGWCSRISIPACGIAAGGKWQVKSVSFLLESTQSGTFASCIFANASGIPGDRISTRKVVSFPANMNGSDSWVKVDFTNENIWVTGDFFVALYQEIASAPNVVMSKVNEKRSYGFNGIGWAEDSLSLVCSAMLWPSTETYMKGFRPDRNGSKDIVIHQREGSLVFELLNKDCIQSAVLYSLKGQQIWKANTPVFGSNMVVYNNSSIQPGSYIIRINGIAGNISKLFHIK